MLLAMNSMLVNQQSVLNETSLNKNAYKTRLCAKLLLSYPTGALRSRSHWSLSKIRSSVLPEWFENQTAQYVS